MSEGGTVQSGTYAVRTNRRQRHTRKYRLQLQSRQVRTESRSLLLPYAHVFCLTTKSLWNRHRSLQPATERDGGDELVTDGGRIPSSDDIEHSHQLRLLRSEDESHHYECPACGDWVAEWQDCPHCGWYDGDAWRAAAKRRKTGAQIAAAEPIDLEGFR